MTNPQHLRSSSNWSPRPPQCVPLGCVWIYQFRSALTVLDYDKCWIYPRPVVLNNIFRTPLKAAACSWSHALSRHETWNLRLSMAIVPQTIKNHRLFFVPQKTRRPGSCFCPIILQRTGDQQLFSFLMPISAWEGRSPSFFVTRDDFWFSGLQRSSAIYLALAHPFVGVKCGQRH